MSPRSKRHSPDPREGSHLAEVTPEQVTAHLATLTQPASIRQIAHGMDLKHRGRRYLPRVIQQLKRRGDIEEIHGGRYRLAGAKHAQRNQPARPAAASAATSREKVAVTQPRSEPTQAGVGAAQPADQAAHAATAKQVRDLTLISGRIVAHRDGYGFLVPDSPIPRVDGDLYIGRENLADAIHGDRVLARTVPRRADGLAEVRVVQILDRAHPTLVVLFR